MRNVINWWKTWWKHHQQVCKQVKDREDEMWERRHELQPMRSTKASTDADSRFWPFGDGGGMA